MKKIFGFLALAFLSVYAFAQDCVTTDVNLSGTASVTFSRYEHKVLTGVFSVAADKHVIFSQGNLQYQASSNTWRFAEEQYEKISTTGYTHNGVVTASGNATEEASRSTQSAWIDLFGWGTSGWSESGANLYEPWSSLGGANANSLEYLAGGATADLIGANAESDWAYHNVIINGGMDNAGPSAHVWQLLTSEEWDYLFHSRINASEKFGFGVLLGVNGLFLLPDSWSWTSFAGTEFDESKWTPGAGVNYATSNVITDKDVWTEMERAGVVFLPTTAYRNGVGLTAFAYGYYWSSTANTRYSSYYFTFYCSSNSTLSITNGQKYRGHAVRPVYRLD